MHPENLEEPSMPSHLISSRRLLRLSDATTREADNSSTCETVIRRARYLQRFMGHLWNRWRQECILTLRESFRLLDSAGQTMQIVDIVSVHDESLPVWNGEWGSCTNRQKDKRSSHPHFSRPLQRLFPLEILDDVKRKPESFTEEVISVLKEGNPELIEAELKETPPRPRRLTAQAGE